MNTSKTKGSSNAGSNHLDHFDNGQLVTELLGRARKRSHTLTELAQHLSVSYRQLVNWRNNKHAIGRASRHTHERIAQYLDISVITVLALAGTITLKDLLCPGDVGLSARVKAELEKARDDPLYGVWTPPALREAPEDVKLFVVFLFDELRANSRPNWLHALREILTRSDEGTPEETPELDALKQASPRDSDSGSAS